MNSKDRALLADCLGLIDDVINHAYNGYPAAQDVVQRAEELEDTINASLHRRGLWLRVADWGRGVGYRVRHTGWWGMVKVRIQKQFKKESHESRD